MLPIFIRGKDLNPCSTADILSPPTRTLTPRHHNMTMTMLSQVPEDITELMLDPSDPAPEDGIPVQGPDFDKDLSLDGLLRSYERIGFQATSLGRAINIVNRMVSLLFVRGIQAHRLSYSMQRKWRPSEEPVALDGLGEEYLQAKAQLRCNIFLGYTSNIISSGLREVLLYLVKHKLVSVLVTTAGGIEEDFIKCLGKHYLADFHLKGEELYDKGYNRIGNLISPNNNYCDFSRWFLPILDTMLEEQQASGKVWTPSAIIHRLGKEINNEESVYYWAYKVNTMQHPASPAQLSGYG